MICFTRIDNRLIHGQIVQGWLPQMKADKVVVISKQSSENILMSKMMRMALPEKYELDITDSSKVKESIKDETKKIFLLIEDVKQLFEVAAQGVILQTVNIGNTKYEEGKKEFATGVYFNEDDLKMLSELKKQNIVFSIKALPSSMEAKINV